MQWHIQRWMIQRYIFLTEDFEEVINKCTRKTRNKCLWHSLYLMLAECLNMVTLFFCSLNYWFVTLASVYWITEEIGWEMLSFQVSEYRIPEQYNA